MRVSCRGKVMEIEDWALSLSPFLSTMIRTEYMVAKDTNGYPMIDVQPAIMRQYIRYLHGYPFMMNQKVEHLLSFMGHGERNGKPSGLCMAELRDAWTRYHFENRELWKYHTMSLMSFATGTSYAEKDGLYTIGRAAYGYRGRHLCNAYEQDGQALLSDNIRCTTINYESPSYEHDDQFYIESTSRALVERKVWRSINDIAFFHSASAGMVLSLSDGIIYTTHVCNWMLKHDPKRWMNDAWIALKAWCPFRSVIYPMIYYHPRGCIGGTIVSYLPVGMGLGWDGED